MNEFERYVICDLDGCLSDDRWRRDFLPSPGGKDYDFYHKLCGSDPVNLECLEELKAALSRNTRTAALIVTSRPEKWNQVTAEWLDRKGLTDWVLLMRPDGNQDRSPRLKNQLINDYFSGIYDCPGTGWARVVCAFDDREDVLESFPLRASERRLITMPWTPKPRNAAQILSGMAQTFAERNAVYSDNYLRVAPAIRAMFPEGVPADLVTSDRWHLFELIVVKLTRFATSGLTHTDSIHDAAIYAAMIEADLEVKSGRKV